MKVNVLRMAILTFVRLRITYAAVKYYTRELILYLTINIYSYVTAQNM